MTDRNDDEQRRLPLAPHERAMLADLEMREHSGERTARETVELTLKKYAELLTAYLARGEHIA